MGADVQSNAAVGLDRSAIGVASAAVVRDQGTPELQEAVEQGHLSVSAAQPPERALNGPDSTTQFDIGVPTFAGPSQLHGETYTELHCEFRRSPRQGGSPVASACAVATPRPGAQ